MVVFPRRFVTGIVFIVGFGALVSAGRAEGPAQQDRGHSAAVEVEIASPFELSDAEEERLNDVLHKWEQQSSKIRSYCCEFTRFEYDRVFGLGDEARVNHGRIVYKWPCSESFQLKNAMRQVERWDRDENAVYKFDYGQKTVRVFPIRNGERPIGSWPIPLVYHVSADDLNRDYWLRIKPDHDVKGRIWIELHPRRKPSGLAAAVQQFTADQTAGKHFLRYQRLDVLLDDESLATCAVRVPFIGGRQTTFVFGQVYASPDSPATAIYCWFTSVPNGWKKVIVP